ncbi:hypothetical protein EJ04DRAFT_508055 [Polyplosphaeria fusca]|uniref:Uncharacterized protein n=1 Tax=Polyplosphaeria fusca TaxID=682080 RepID=A0A9P4V5E2_9PLEO|nr:hypothetical protein EJ04DRAFT_508055 [Polyplosphaeria fusca]
MDNRCLLLEIPPELRLLIYESLWVPLSAQINTPNGYLPPSDITTSRDLSLLLACKQIYSEAYRLAFRSHTFTLSRDLDACPLLAEPRWSPTDSITSILIPAFHTSSYCSLETGATDIPYKARCYQFKEICALVRRFKHLDHIIVVTDDLSAVRRSMCNRVAQYHFRLKKARYLQDDRFLPSYSLTYPRGGRSTWRLEVAGSDGQKGKAADMIICSLRHGNDNLES